MRSSPPCKVKSQFANDPRLMAGTAPKDVVARGRDRCIAISTEASLREMVYPSALVMLAPLLAGTGREQAQTRSRNCSRPHVPRKGSTRDTRLPPRATFYSGRIRFAVPITQVLFGFARAVSWCARALLFLRCSGTFFGVYAVFGLLTGGLVSGVQLAISMSNTGGAWDNAKKFIEQKLSDDPELRGKVYTRARWWWRTSSIKPRAFLRAALFFFFFSLFLWLFLLSDLE